MSKLLYKDNYGEYCYEGDVIGCWMDTCCHPNKNFQPRPCVVFAFDHGKDIAFFVEDEVAARNIVVMMYNNDMVDISDYRVAEYHLYDDLVSYHAKDGVDLADIQKEAKETWDSREE